MADAAAGRVVVLLFWDSKGADDVLVHKAVEVLARRDGTPVLVRQGHLLASTFHPELSADLRVHQLFVDMARTVAAERLGNG